MSNGSHTTTTHTQSGQSSQSRSYVSPPRRGPSPRPAVPNANEPFQTVAVGTLRPEPLVARLQAAIRDYGEGRITRAVALEIIENSLASTGDSDDTARRTALDDYVRQLDALDEEDDGPRGSRGDDREGGRRGRDRDDDREGPARRLPEDLDAHQRAAFIENLNGRAERRQSGDGGRRGGGGGGGGEGGGDGGGGDSGDRRGFGKERRHGGGRRSGGRGRGGDGDGDGGGGSSDDESSSSDDEPPKKRLKPSDMPWYQAEQTAAPHARASCLESARLLELFARDYRVVKRWISNSPVAPEAFPSSEWENIIKGRPVNLDVVLSSMFHLTAPKENIGRIGDHQLSLGTTEPSKKVQDYGDWNIAWNRASAAIEFVFEHRRDELREYGAYIQGEFSARLPEAHSRVMDYDAFARHRTAILAPDGLFSGTHSSFASGSRGRRLGEICNRFNSKNGCLNGVSDCKYRHACKNCGKGGGQHGASSCSESK